MEKEFVSYKQALSLKELGYDEGCCGYFGHKTSKLYECNFRDIIAKGITKAPLWQQVFYWFREKYEYCSYIKEARKETYRFYIEKFDKKFFNSEVYNTHQEAQTECLNKLIEVVEQFKKK